MGCFELCMMILISSIKLVMLILSHSSSSFWTVFVWEAHLCLKVHLYIYNLLHSSLSGCLKEHACTTSSSPLYQNTHVQPPLLFTRVFEGTPMYSLLHSSYAGLLLHCSVRQRGAGPEGADAAKSPALWVPSHSPTAETHHPLPPSCGQRPQSSQGEGHPRGRRASGGIARTADEEHATGRPRKSSLLRRLLPR